VIKCPPSHITTCNIFILETMLFGKYRDVYDF
jgi:hypothetical protein